MYLKYLLFNSSQVFHKSTPTYFFLINLQFKQVPFFSRSILRIVVKKKKKRASQNPIAQKKMEEIDPDYE